MSSTGTPAKRAVEAATPLMSWALGVIVPVVNGRMISASHREMVSLDAAE